MKMKKVTLSKILSLLFLLCFTIISCTNGLRPEIIEINGGSSITEKAASAVYHFKQSVDGVSYEIADSESKSVSAGTTLSELAKTYTGFTAQGLMVSENTDGSYYVNIYYTRNIITVTLNGNGGTIGGKTVATQKGLYGTTFPQAKTLSLVHDTKVFGGWNTNADGTGTAYDDAGFTYDRDITLYAQWLNFYEVSAVEAASKIESLASGTYTVKVTGEINASILSDIKAALLADENRYIALDLSAITGLTELGEEAFTSKVNYTYIGTPIVSLILPNTVTKIGKYCFYNCKKLVSVIAPGVKVLDTGAFYVCDAMTEVILADELESIGALAFGYCASLEELTLNAKAIGNSVVLSNKKLTKLTIGEAVETIADGAIESATSLAMIAVAEENTHFKVIDGILYSYDGTRLLRCPSALEITDIILANTVKTMDEYAFADCKNLTSITVPNVENIPDNAFQSAKDLTTVSIPKATKICGMAFYRCEKLMSIYLPDTLTSIGMYAFAYDTSLTTIYIPSSVTTMSSYVFNGWTADQTINCAANSALSGWDEDWSCYSYGTDAKATINWGQSRS